MTRSPRFAWPSLLLALALVVPSGADDRPTRVEQEGDRLKVGVQPDGRIVVPTNQILQPFGQQISFPGRPVDLLLVEQGRTLVVKNMRDLIFLDTATGLIRQTLKLGSDARTVGGFSVVGLASAGDRIFASDTRSAIRVARRLGNGQYAWEDSSLTLPAPAAGGAAFPTGLAVLGEQLLAASSRGNQVHVFHLPQRALAQTVPVGIAPYAILPLGPERALVSNWGGAPPEANDPAAPSSGTPVRIDARGIAASGTVSLLQKGPAGWSVAKSIPVGLHPAGLCASPRQTRAYVACAASDTIDVLDPDRGVVVESIPCRPENRLPFGSGSNAVCLSPDGATLYVANGTNNGVAVIQLGRAAREDGQGPERSVLSGMIPVGWYPGAVARSGDGKRLFVANVKGHGALSQPRPLEKGRNSHDHLGTVSLIDLPNAETLAELTARSGRNNRQAYSLAGLEKPRPDAVKTPVPERHGEPSLFEHVIYVIKENRTYDQVLGDMPEGNGDPKLCIFGAEVTPNHHKLAREFTLFDNFYCSGVLSADGHQWVNEAYVTDYLEKAFGGFTRSYPYEGNDPLAFAPSGFLWDEALRRGRTLRNYGEFCKTTFAPKGPSWREMFEASRKPPGATRITSVANVAPLRPHTHPSYPGFHLNVPDVYRAELFLQELRQCEARGAFPNLVYLYLPCDHTNGTRPTSPTPRAMVADNDLALGRVVEAVSRSPFWSKTVMFVVEDDPQNGFDHVDGHRTVAFAISPYTRRKFVDSTCYNQTGMVKTIELILGLPPMNQLDLSATAMRGCFQNEPDVRPYTAVPNRIPLDEMNKPVAELRGQALAMAKLSLELNLDECDAADEDALNRILWWSIRGEETYPKDRVNGQ